MRLQVCAIKILHQSGRPHGNAISENDSNSNNVSAEFALGTEWKFQGPAGNFTISSNKFRRRQNERARARPLGPFGRRGPHPARRFQSQQSED